MRLKIAAIPQDETYFREQVAPHIDGDRVQFLGAVERDARNELLSNALALVHMTTRPERFGLTTDRGDGLRHAGARRADGLDSRDRRRRRDRAFCATTSTMRSRKVPLLASLDRHACRAHVEREFSVERMIDRYLGVYARALELRIPPPPSEEKLRARRHDWWDRPMAYTEIPPKPKNLGFS